MQKTSFCLLQPRTPVKTSAQKSASPAQTTVTVQGHSYLLGAELGKGGSCVVYKAKDTRSNADVAVKIVQLANLVPQMQSMHRNEVRILNEFQDSDYVVKLIGL